MSYQFSPVVLFISKRTGILLLDWKFFDTIRDGLRTDLRSYFMGSGPEKVRPSKSKCPDEILFVVSSRILCLTLGPFKGSCPVAVCITAISHVT